jgi:hypothetical protein
VFILEVLKVLYFHTLLQVFILKVVSEGVSPPALLGKTSGPSALSWVNESRCQADKKDGNMGVEAEVRYSRLTPLRCSVNDSKGGTPGQLVGGMVEGQVIDF